MKTRKSRQPLSLEAFKKSAVQRLDFLRTEYGFYLNLSDGSGGVYLLFQNKTTAVKVAYEPRDRGVFALVMRLVHGAIPEYPNFDNFDEPVNCFYLEDIVNFNLGNFDEITSVKEAPDGEEDVERKLSALAEQLKSRAANILRGDFSSFPELEIFIKERARKIARMQ